MFGFARSRSLRAYNAFFDSDTGSLGSRDDWDSLRDVASSFHQQGERNTLKLVKFERERERDREREREREREKGISEFGKYTKESNQVAPTLTSKGSDEVTNPSTKYCSMSDCALWSSTGPHREQSEAKLNLQGCRHTAANSSSAPAWTTGKSDHI